MRHLCALLFSLTCLAQSISVMPGLPTTGSPTTLVFTFPLGVPISPVTWEFGDGVALTGGPIITHVYKQPGTYLVLANAAALGASTQIRVVTGRGPAAPFAISLLRMRWEDGRTDASVIQGFTPLAAYADLKFEGAGLLLAQWTVDDVPLGTFTRQLGFAGQVTLDTRMFIPLPTTELGEHLVTLRILSPNTTFESPTLRYFVRVGDAKDLPRIEAISPSTLRRGEEMELRVSGRGFGPGVQLYFGRDVALVAAPQVSSPSHAVVKVFVAPTAHIGPREAQTITKGKRAQGPAQLQILPAHVVKVPKPANGGGPP